MRSFLAVMYLTPIALGIAIQNGTELVTPLIAVMCALALAMSAVEKRVRG